MPINLQYFFGSRAAGKMSIHKLVKKNNFCFLFLLKSYFFSLSCEAHKPDFCATEDSKDRIGIFIEISANIKDQIFDFGYALLTIFKNVLKNWIFCQYSHIALSNKCFYLYQNIRQKFKKAALYVIFYAFEDYKMPIVFNLG